MSEPEGVFGVGKEASAAMLSLTVGIPSAATPGVCRQSSGSLARSCFLFLAHDSEKETAGNVVEPSRESQHASFSSCGYFSMQRAP